MGEACALFQCAVFRGIYYRRAGLFRMVFYAFARFNQRRFL